MIRMAVLTGESFVLFMIEYLPIKVVGDEQHFPFYLFRLLQDMEILGRGQDSRPAITICIHMLHAIPWVMTGGITWNNRITSNNHPSTGSTE